MKQVALHLPFRTILVILVTLLLVHSAEVLAPLMMPLFIAALLAVTLHPVLVWLETYRCPRWVSLFMITISLSFFMIGIVLALIPRLMDELSIFLENLPQLKTELLTHISDNNPLRGMISQNLSKSALIPAHTDLSHFYDVGTRAFGGLTELVLILVFTVYLVVDGSRIIHWSTAFLKQETQKKVRQTFTEVSSIIFAYASGQFITSVLSFVYTFVALWALKVPGALLLAVLAGIFDVLPVLGFFLAVFPALLFALRVSSETCLYVLLVYVAYHILENYLIAPWVYGNRLRLSGFTVLFATLSAGFLAGIEGAISILPVVASYPVIEKIWLRSYIGGDVVDEHDSMKDKADEELEKEIAEKFSSEKDGKDPTSSEHT